MYCSKCGSPMKEDANFCLHCGGKKEDSPANILVEPIVESEKPLKTATESSQNSWKDYTTSQDMGGIVPDVDPSLFDLDSDHMDREKQEPEKKIDLGAGLDFGAPRQSIETMPPLNAEPMPTPAEPQTIQNSPVPPTFVAPSFPITPDIPSQGKPINLQPKVVGTYYSDKIPQGFVLDSSSGLYFKSINKIDPITNQIIEEVTYYNDATKEVSVVVYPKEQPTPAPPIMGDSVHSTAAQDASRNKSNSWIVIVIVILVVALLIAVIAGVIGFAGSKGSRRENTTSSKTSSSVLGSRGNRKRNSSQEESAEVSFFNDDEEYSSEEGDAIRKTDYLNPVYSKTALYEKDYFFDSYSEGTLKKRMGFDGNDYYYFPNHVAFEDFEAGNENGAERYLYRMEVGSDTPEIFLDVGENNSIYSYEVFEDIVYIAVNSILDSALGGSCDYYVCDIMNNSLVYLFTLSPQRLIGAGGFIYVNDHNSNQIIAIGRDSGGEFAYNTLEYTVPEGSYQTYSSTSVIANQLLICLVNEANEFTYSTYEMTRGTTKELIRIDEEYVPYNAYFIDDLVFYSRQLYGEESDTTTIVAVEDGIETIVATVTYGDSFYGKFASFDGDTFAYKNGNQIICIPYKSGVLGESYARDNVEEAYGMADGVILFSNSIFDIETSKNTIFKTPVESEYLMQPSLFDEAVNDYNYIY